MAKTKIEWATDVWNPVTGCSAISEGCKNCYARRMANRLRGRYGYPKDEPFRITFHEDKIELPAWRKPRMVFVCSMGDLFHDDVRKKWISRVFLMISHNPNHTFLILTKRPERMLMFISRCKEWEGFITHNGSPVEKAYNGNGYLVGHSNNWPLPNLWLGVTVEHPDYLWRIDELLKIPAAVRFVSVEPMLSSVDIDDYINHYDYSNDKIDDPFIDWVIAGPETGPGKRECKPEWIRNLYEQCQQAGVPFFDKTKTNWIAREFPIEGRRAKVIKIREEK